MKCNAKAMLQKAQNRTLQFNEFELKKYMDKEFDKVIAEKYKLIGKDIVVQWLGLLMYVEEKNHRHTMDYCRKLMLEVFHMAKNLDTGFGGFCDSVNAIDVVGHFKKKGLDIYKEFNTFEVGVEREH